MTASVELTGGCSGHLAEWDDDRCYCDSPDVHIEFTCPNAKEGEYKIVGHGKRGPRREWFKNKNACKQPPLKVGELSDQYSLARWFTEHYEPSADAKIF
jgi:hypothetical protein